MDPAELALKIQRDAPSFSTPEGEKIFIVERDLQVREQDLLAYAASFSKTEHAPAGDAPEKLTAATIDGKPVRWKPGTLLTWTLDRASFPDPDTAEAAHTLCTQAAQDWNDAAEGVIAFKEVSPGEPPVFSFSFQGFGDASLYALAFLPHDPVSQRVVRMGPMIFSPEPYFDPVGVLRHELGHVLGFRHEHIRPEGPEQAEAWTLGTMSAEALGEYDSQSVMHYPIAGLGSRDLNITPLDKAGLKVLYTRPASEVTEYLP